MSRVAIIGIGWYGFRPAVEEVSFREMMFEAAARAYEDAGGLNPRTDVDAFASCQEDFWEGIAIADEFAPEPIGGTLKPVFTTTGDGLQCIANAYMMIKTGQMDVVVAESHAKPSDITNIHDIMLFAMDPLTVRSINMPNYHALAALEAQVYIVRHNVPKEALAYVVTKDKRNALHNERASYGANVTIDEVLGSPYVVSPLTKLDIAPFVDASVVVVLASEDVARKYTDTPIWIDGIHWVTEEPSLEFHNWEFPVHAMRAAEAAYKMAGIQDPIKELHFAEVDSRYSFKELQFIEALKLAPIGEAHKLLLEGAFDRDGLFPVNPSGGALGEGVPLEVHGLARLVDAVLQLRGGEAGRMQLSRLRGLLFIHGVAYQLRQVLLPC
ncbi:thiolase domain-containing protein [Vulcanisaeta souniana]|uniref:thiolase domain-containing protein n=1 Tax=Vulcanisaeta souniana TaxID=164452 RepID=UPI000A83EAFD|nr:thiolase domain-containing protein [Vulcanisaeta souniana]